MTRRCIWVLLLAASIASAAAVSVNGNCQVGNCTSPDVLASNSSGSTTFSFTFTLPNSDQYRMVGSIDFSSGPGTTIGIQSPFLVTYLGNQAGTASGADAINIDILQNYQLAFTLRQSAEQALGGFGGALAAGSSVQIQLAINGQALSTMGPFAAPASFSLQVPAVSINPTASPAFVVHHIVTFAAGSGVGATIFNDLTPNATGGTTGTGDEPVVCDSSSSASGNCAVIACDGTGSTLPIVERPSPATGTSGGSSCSAIDGDQVAADGMGGTLPILYPTGPNGSGGGDNTPPVDYPSSGNVAMEGSGSSLPILYPTGPAGGGNSGSGPGVEIACEGTGSSLPIVAPIRGPAVTAAPSPYAIEIATPFQSAPAAYTVSATCNNPSGACWIAVPVTSGTIKAGSSTAVTVLVDTGALTPGTYTGNVTITITPQGQAATTVNVPVTVAAAPRGPYLLLSQSGLQFQAAAGAAAQTQTVAVTNAGSGSLEFTATVSSGAANWLSVSPASGTVTATPAQVAIQANPANLAPGVYSGLVEFSGPGIMNGTQSVVVAVTVPAAGPAPSLSSNALVFVAAAGSNPPPQMVQLFNPANQTLTVSTGISYAGTSGWFTASGSAATATAAQPLTEAILVNSADLPAGVYRGAMDLHIAETGSDELLAVMLVVKPAACTPSQLLPVVTNLGGGFAVTAGAPVPIQALVVDDCGTPLTSGAVTAYFPGGDPSVPFTSLGQGLWSGTWMPHAIAAAGTATVGLIASSNTAALYGSAGIIGSVSANPAVPVVFSGGAVSAASYAEAPLAPGLWVSIFGANLATQTAEDDNSPYQTTLGGTQVLLDGEPMPLHVAASGQINALAPYDLPIGAPQQLIVEQGGQYSMPENVVLAAAQPSTFTLNESGSGAAAIVVFKPDGSYFINGSGQAASAGDVLAIYCTGLGAVSPPVAAGLAAPSPSQTSDTVTVTIGGVPAMVAFAGLTEGFVGLYQVNATVPAGVAPGTNVPVVVSAGGASSLPVTVTIQ